MRRGTNKKSKYTATPIRSAMKAKGRGSRLMSTSRLTFVSTPMVREYFGDAPANFNTNGRENLNVSPSLMKSTDLSTELQVRELEGLATTMSPREKANKVETLWRGELERELNSYEFPTPTSNMPREELVARLNLIKRLMSRANLYVLKNILVTENTNEQLQEQLLHYREAVHGTNACESRAQYEDRLVSALLKDTGGKTGNGYDHGQRFMSVDEELEDMTHVDLQQALEFREVIDIPTTYDGKYQKLILLMEEEHEELLEGAVEIVVENELKIRNLPFTKTAMVNWIQNKIKQDKKIVADIKAAKSKAKAKPKLSKSTKTSKVSSKASSKNDTKTSMSGRKRRRGESVDKEVYNSDLGDYVDVSESEVQRGTPLKKKRRIEVISSPSANPNATTTQSNSNPIPVDTVEINFPKVKSWKKLTSKQIQLELLLVHFDNQKISFDVSWNDIPSYHSIGAIDLSNGEEKNDVSDEEKEGSYCQIM